MARMMIPAPAMHAKAKNPVHKASLRVTASASPQPEPPRSRSRVQAAVRERDSVPSPNSRRAMYGVRRPRTAEQPCNAGIAHKP